MTPRYNERIARAIVEDAFGTDEPVFGRPDDLMRKPAPHVYLGVEMQRQHISELREQIVQCHAETEAWKRAWRMALEVSQRWRTQTLSTVGISLIFGVWLGVAAMVIARAL